MGKAPVILPPHRRRIKTEEKAKVVVSAEGGRIDYIPILHQDDLKNELHQEDMKKRMNCRMI